MKEYYMQVQKYNETPLSNQLTLMKTSKNWSFHLSGFKSLSFLVRPGMVSQDNHHLHKPAPTNIPDLSVVLEYHFQE
jgi:hypothetical protein